MTYVSCGGFASKIKSCTPVAVCYPPPTPTTTRTQHSHAHTGYLFQWLPSLGWMIMKSAGPKRAQALKEGRSGYDVRGITMGSPKAGGTGKKDE